VVITLDGKQLGEVTAEPFNYTWDALSATPGLHELTVTAEDHVGNRAATTAQMAVVPPAQVAFVAAGRKRHLDRYRPVTLVANSVRMNKNW